MASLKNTIAKKDEEIERLQSLKSVFPGTDGERCGSGSLLRNGSHSSSRESVGGTAKKSQKPSSSVKGLGLAEKAASEYDNSSEYSDKHYSKEADSLQSMEEDEDEDFKLRNDIGQNITADDEMLRFGDDADCEERLSDISDGGRSVGTELTDGSIENAIFAEGRTKSNNSDR